VRRRLVALTVVPLLLFGSAACGDEGAAPSDGETQVDMGEAIPGVTITGEVGDRPKVEIDAPVEIDKTQAQVITAGEGDPVVEGEQTLLHIDVYNATTGKEAVNTYEEGQPVPVQMSDDQFFPSLIDQLVGKPSGSRVAVAAVPKDAYAAAGAPQIGISGKDNVLFVIDVMSVAPTDVLDGPEGEAPAEVPQDIPGVVEEDGKVTGLSFENAPGQPSKELEVVTLIEGEGEPVRKGSLVTFDYLGQIYGTDKVFDESYSGEPRTFTVGAGQLIKAWDEGLVDVKKGSRVLIIAPPEFGYGPSGNPQSDPPIKGTDTLAFVVDILGVG
jgi:peptidylprolyl isomerase